MTKLLTPKALNRFAEFSHQGVIDRLLLSPASIKKWSAIDPVIASKVSVNKRQLFSHKSEQLIVESVGGASQAHNRPLETGRT